MARRRAGILIAAFDGTRRTFHSIEGSLTRLRERARAPECPAQATRSRVRQADRDEGLREDGTSSVEREELRRLRRENRVLRQECRILMESRRLMRSGDRPGAGEVCRLVRAAEAAGSVATMCG